MKTKLLTKIIVPVLMGKMKWLLNDEYTSPLAAGSVNGTAPEPGPGGNRVVVDTNSKLSIAGGQLSAATGGVGANEPRISYDSLVRVAGSMLMVSINSSIEGARVGLNSANTSVAKNAFILVSTNILIDKSNGGFIVVGAWSTSTQYKLGIVIRALGKFNFIKGGAFTNWTLLWHDLNRNDDPLYPIICAADNTSVFVADSISISENVWFPTPLVFDTFTRANGALGSSEESGPDAQVITARVWTGATYAIDTNETKNTPTLGGELAANNAFAADSDWDKGTAWAIAGGVATHDGDSGILKQDIGAANKWYVVAWEIVRRAAGSANMRLGTFNGPNKNALAIYVHTGRATAVELGVRGNNDSDLDIDDVSIKELTLSSLLASLESSTADVLVDVDIAVDPDGTQAGLVMNLDSAATPANFVISYHTGTKAVLEKCVAGTYTTVITVGAAFAAGATLRVVKDGENYSLFYNDSVVGTTQVINDAGIVDNTLHGMFNTHVDNRLDNFTVFPRGSNDEYVELDRYT